MNRRTALGVLFSAPLAATSVVTSAVTGAATAPRASAQSAPAQGIAMTVYKTSTCGCCGMWVKHVFEAGFAPAVQDVTDIYERKDKMGIPEALQSCHTALVGGYIIEGHVPAAEIHRLLKEKPAAKGLAVPGMPMGSPGMDMGPKKDAYEVVLFTEDGKTSVYQKYPGN